jgi:hypothetical protein
VRGDSRRRGLKRGRRRVALGTDDHARRVGKRRAKSRAFCRRSSLPVSCYGRRAAESDCSAR